MTCLFIQVNQSQMVRNLGRVDSGVTAGGGGGGAGGSQPSPSQLRVLVQQIQMAVQAGHLNPQILNQPLAPQTLVLLNQLLQQIKVLQQLGQQHTMALSRPGQGGPMGGAMMQIVPQMNKTKQQIASLQQQIAAQQALYVKQQQGQGLMSQQPPGAPPGQGSDLFKVDSVHGLQSTLDRMSLQDAGQSRLSQWKYPLDKDLDMGMSEFSRAPGSSGGGGPGSSTLPGGNVKPPLGTSLSSPNMNPVLGQDASAWSSLSRSQSETGWPDSGQDLSAPIGDGKDSWSSGAGTSSYAGSISDLVPEFEPGKPWKGPQIKTADDDPTLTPGTFAMSGLNDADVYANNSSKGANSTKSSPPPAGAAGSGSGGSGGSGPGEAGFSTLGLSNSTWSFNPSSASTGAAPSASTTPFSTAKTGPKTTWSDAPPPSADPWSAPNKPRGPPPGITTAAGSQVGAKNAAGGSRDWSSSGSRSPWPGSGPSGSSSSWTGSLNGSSSWLVLRNLTPQIDGSTLKTLCVQHGPLHNFHLYLSHGVALVRYSTGEEAAKVGRNPLFPPFSFCKSQKLNAPFCFSCFLF